MNSARNSNEWHAFALVPFVAAGSWYVLKLVELAVVNGRLRLTTDVLAIGIGTLVLGAPVALVLTVVLALPAYLTVRRLNSVGLLSACVGGLLVGGAASAVARALDDPSLMPVWLGLAVGLVSGFSWWLRSGRPSPSQDRVRRAT